MGGINSKRSSPLLLENNGKLYPRIQSTEEVNGLGLPVIGGEWPPWLRRLT